MRRCGVEQWSEKARPCGDPDCDGTAEPEGDQELRYFSCDVCGFEFGYQRVTTELAEVGGCSLGIPADVRRAASAPMERALGEQAKRSNVVPLTIGFGPPSE